MQNWLTISLSLAILASVWGCDQPLPADSSKKDPGEVAFTIKRSLDSSLPQEANKALIRIWHDSTEFNSVTEITIPDPNQTTSFNMHLPAEDGYEIGVIAFAEAMASSAAENVEHVALAAGHTQNVNIIADSTIQVHVNVVPWIIGWESDKDTLKSGDEFTLTLSVKQGPDNFDFLQNTEYYLALSPWTVDGEGDGNFPSGITKSGYDSATMNVPEVDSDTTLYFQIAPKVHSSWNTPKMAVFQPALVTGKSLFTLPVKEPTGGIEITFEQDKNL